MKTKHPIVYVDGVAGKHCSGCNEWKSLEKYPIDRRATDGRTARCKTCTNVHSRKWYQENREYKLAQNHAYNDSHREQLRENDKRYRAENRERESARILKWVQENRDHRNQTARDWYARQPEDFAAKKSRQFYKNNPKSAKDNDRRKKARRRGREGGHTTDEFFWVVNCLGNKCLDCGKTFNDTDVLPTEDHIDPNGSDNLDNIQPLCHRCNTRKSDRYIKDFRPQWFIDNFTQLKAESGI